MPLLVFFFSFDKEKRNFIDSKRKYITFENINQTTKNIRGWHNIQVNSKKKRLKTYTIGNPEMPRIPNILGLMKYTDEQGFDKISISNRSSVAV